MREIEVDFEKLTLTVPVQNKKVTLRAEPELIKAAIRMKIIKGTMLFLACFFGSFTAEAHAPLGIVEVGILFSF